MARELVKHSLAYEVGWVMQNPSEFYDEATIRRMKQFYDSLE